MKIARKLLLYFILLILTFSLTACKKNEESSSQYSPVKGNAAGWELTVEDLRISESLKDTSTTVGYGGASTSMEVSEKPQLGKVFLLIQLTAEKKEGAETIEWSKLSLLDSAGNRYTRLNDSFIESFGFKRMKGTPLSFGKNEGWIAFEINKDARDFKFQLDFTKETINLELKN